MVPHPAKQKALAMKKLPGNRTWDCVYEIYSHLQKKNRVLKSGTERLNYIKTLLDGFHVKDQKPDPELMRFMGNLCGIVQSHMHNLQYPNIENTAEENGTKVDDDDVMVDPQYMYFFDHLRPHGTSYVLDIIEDGVFTKYESESSSPIHTNHVSNEEVNVCLEADTLVNPHANYKSSNVISNHVKRRGRKRKAAKISAALDVHVKSNSVAAKVEKHESNLMGKRRSNRLQKYALKTTLKSEDSDDEVQDITSSMQRQIVCWQEDNETNAGILFREKLMEELKAPYCDEERKRLLHDITVQKPVQHHRDLRGRIKIYEKHCLGKSFLAYHVDLKEKIETAHDDHPRVLNLLRGFFFWLKNLSHDGAFIPWKDPSCLDVLPQQLLEG